LDAYLPTASNYTKYGSLSLDTTIGVALSGIVMFSSLSADDVDPFFPNLTYSATAAVEMVDTCLMHPQNTGVFHYHCLPPCVINVTYGYPEKDCATSGTECDTDMMTYAIDAYADYKTQYPIGLAKDGHIIYGPYTTDGVIWAACDVDICNGFYYDTEYYGYAATSFHPYFVGCWGPGNDPTISQLCSTNPRDCTNTTTVTTTGSTTSSFATLINFSVSILLLQMVNYI